MTYFEAAQELVNLYAEYVSTRAEYDEGYNDYSEALVVAVEALLIKAEREKMEAMTYEALSQMQGLAPLTPVSNEVFQMIGRIENDSLRGD